MPWPWYAGSTEIGPSPYQPPDPSERETGDTATWPTTVPSTSATNETVSFPVLRSALTMNCSVWSVWGAVRKAAVVTALMASTSAARSLRISTSIEFLCGGAPWLWAVDGFCLGLGIPLWV
ncbi:hypothetical protein D3C80_1566730 [compost metagenome]